MYQPDIAGYNAFDYAFKQNAIFCIKAFAEKLLIMSEEIQFRNCIDHAILLMIDRGMDVKELVTSSLFFTPIWYKKSLYSRIKTQKIMAYNNELEDLEFMDPDSIFEDKTLE